MDGGRDSAASDAEGTRFAQVLSELCDGRRELSAIPLFGANVLERQVAFRSSVGSPPSHHAAARHRLDLCLKKVFLNLAKTFKSQLLRRNPLSLLQNLLVIERAQGRLRQFKNAPRTLDLDMLLYDDLQHHEHGLTLPHPQMHLRAFVLQPLLEIAPDCVIPGIGSAAAALNHCQEQKLERLIEEAGKAD